MYESFFKLSRRPFPAAPQIDYYFPARAIEAARRTLVRCIDRAEGAGVLIGPSGSGKTLVCQLLAQRFADTFEIVLLGSTRLDTPHDLLQAALFELGLPCRGLSDGDLRLSLIDHLTRSAGQSAGMLLIADEAHKLPARVLEEIRLITNIAVAGKPRVRFVMAGGPALEERLASPKLASLSQRTAARCYLEPLSRSETANYIRAALAASGADVQQTFSEAALVSVYRATDGIPRLVNQLCDHALVLAFADGVKHLGEREIEEAWADLQQLPTPWNASPARDAAAVQDDVIQFGQLDESGQDAEPLHVSLRLAPQPLDSGPNEQLHQIEEQLASIEIGVEPRAATSVEVAQSANPFAESFVEEEIVVDRFASSQATAWAQMPHVYSGEGRQLAALLAPLVQTARPVEVATAATWAEMSDPDLIVVEDEPAVLRPTLGPSYRALRQEYSQLFAKLRRG
jgi:type II secretory pathway predicted ATPase ExeA